MSEQNTLGDFSGKGEHTHDWQTVQLGDETYFARYSGDTPTKSNEEYWGGDIRWLSNSEVRDGTVNFTNETEERITKQGLENCTAEVVPKNSVILSCTASIGKVAINKRRMATNQQFNTFEIKQGFEPYYLANQFLSMKEELETLGGSTTHNHLSVYLLDKVEVSQPPLSEQRKIATVLYTVDQAIQNTEDVLGRYEQLQTGLLRKYFGKSSDQNSQFEKRESKRLGPTTLNVPKEWEVVQIDDIGEVFTGNTPSTDREEYFGGSLPFITPENFNDSKYVHNGNRTLTTEGSEKVPVLPKNSVMVECIGRVGRIRMTGDKLATNQQINSVIADDSQMNPEFLYYHLLALSDIIEAQAGQTTTPILRKSLFESLNIFCPPEDDQEKIVQSMDIFEDAKEKERERLSKLMSMKKGLMQDLLSGAVRTHEVDIDISEAVLAHG